MRPVYPEPCRQDRHTELQTVEVCRRVDLVAEPTTGLRTGVTRQEGLQVEDFAQLVVQLVAAAVVYQFVSSCAVPPNGTAVKYAYAGC